MHFLTRIGMEGRNIADIFHSIVLKESFAGPEKKTVGACAGGSYLFNLCVL